MTDPFLGEIRAFGFDFAPRGWAVCDGQTLPLAQNTALFSLLGTTYGGNGSSTYGLPNLQGRGVISPGQGPGLTDRGLGEPVGTQSVTLQTNELPVHTHTAQASSDSADNAAPAPDRTLGRTSPGLAYTADTGQTLVPLAAEATAPQGGNLPHDNLSPLLVLNFCIALQGVFPPRP